MLCQCLDVNKVHRHLAVRLQEVIFQRLQETEKYHFKTVKAAERLFLTCLFFNVLFLVRFLFQNSPIFSLHVSQRSLDMDVFSVWEIFHLLWSKRVSCLLVAWLTWRTYTCYVYMWTCSCRHGDQVCVDTCDAVSLCDTTCRCSGKTEFLTFG